MLIDGSHRGWIVLTSAIAVAASVVYFLADRATPGGLTGGAVVGLIYGIIGSALMILVGLLSAFRKAPGWWWLGPRRFWMKAHIWLGLLSAVFLLCHARFRWGGPLEIALWAVYAAVIVTGIYGLLLQQMLPRMLTSRIPCEAPYEQIPTICGGLRSRAEALFQKVCIAVTPATSNDMTMTVGFTTQPMDINRMQFEQFFEQHVRPFLSEPPRRKHTLLDPLRGEAMFVIVKSLPGLAHVKEDVEQLEALCRERRLLADQERIYHWLHGWLLLHIPLSALLLVLGVAHAVMSLYY
ncbi:MAG: hypothetical protein ACRC1K_17810 [Planctomycetia bacterium]